MQPYNCSCRKRKVFWKTFRVCVIKWSKVLWFVDADVSKNTGKKSNAKKKRPKQVKKNPVMYCSGSNTDKESLVQSCVSETIVSSASLSQTNQIEAFDTFIVRKVNPRTDGENATNYFTKFSTDSNENSTFHPDFNVSLNNHASNLSKILSQSRSTINSNRSEIIYNNISTKSSNVI